tara:strand:+ start:106 stop:390 length:285 start_codon:yes stop_codon:yes gene_type:complete
MTEGIKIIVKKIVINQETYLNSLIKDLTSIGLLALLCWFNYAFIGGSYFVNFLIFCAIMCYISSLQKIRHKDFTFYHNVSSAKISKIKEIIEND